VANLLVHLPSESSYSTRMIALHPPEIDDDPNAPFGPWSHEDLLLAAIFDSIQQLIHVQIARAGVSGEQPPEPMRRPGIGAKTKVNPAQAAYLQRLREHHQSLKEGDADG
jgi:hypothetical protein